MLQTMQMQEDLWDLSVECFGQLNNKIEDLSKRMLHQSLSPASQPVSGDPNELQQTRQDSRGSARSGAESYYESAEQTCDFLQTGEHRPGESVLETAGQTGELSRIHSMESNPFESRASDGSQMDISLQSHGAQMAHGVDQPRTSVCMDFLAPKTEERRRREESLDLQSLLESAMAKVERKLELLLAETRALPREQLSFHAEAQSPTLMQAKEKVKSKKKGGMLHPEAFRQGRKQKYSRMISH